LNKILELLDKCEQDDNVRCVMFTHVGDNFSISGAGAEEFELINQGLSMVEVSRTFRTSGLELVRRLLEHDITGTLSAVDELSRSGCDLRQALEDLLETARLLSAEIEYSDENVDRLLKHLGG